MSPVTEIALVVRRELWRNLRSAKGIVLLLISLLGGVGSTLSLLAAQRFMVSKAGPGQMAEARLAVLSATFDEATARHLVQSPEALFVMTLGTFSTGALLAAFLGYDTLSGELQHRQIRYFSLRAQSWTLVAGKHLGMFAVCSLLTLSIHLISWIIVALSDGGSFSQVMSWGPRFWLLTLPISFAWCGLVTFVSSLLKTPILALLLTFFALMLSWALFGLGLAYDIEYLTYLHPGRYDRWLLSPELGSFFTGVAASLAWGGLFSGLAVVVISRRDL